MAVDRDAFTHGAAEEFGDGEAQNLASDVPECDVDTADDVCGCASGSHVGEGAEYLVPDHFDEAGVVTFNEIAHVSESGADCSVGDVGGSCDFAPAGYSFVGVHFDKYVFAVLNAVEIVGGLEVWGRGFD